MSFGRSIAWRRSCAAKAGASRASRCGSRSPDRGAQCETGRIALPGPRAYRIAPETPRGQRHAPPGLDLWSVAQPMSRRRLVYEGKAKILYEGPEPGTLIQYFKDDATAFNAQKKGSIAGKGVLNNRISEHIFTLLGGLGIPHHFLRRLNMRDQLIRQVERSEERRVGKE